MIYRYLSHDNPSIEPSEGCMSGRVVPRRTGRRLQRRRADQPKTDLNRASDFGNVPSRMLLRYVLEESNEKMSVKATW